MAPDSRLTRAAVSASSNVAVGAYDGIWAMRSGVSSSAVALMAMTVSPIFMPAFRPPAVPTRMSRLAPSITSSSNTMPDDGQPMPVVCTLIGLPSNVPV